MIEPLEPPRHLYWTPPDSMYQAYLDSVEGPGSVAFVVVWYVFLAWLCYELAFVYRTQPKTKSPPPPRPHSVRKLPKLPGAIPPPPRDSLTVEDPEGDLHRAKLNAWRAESDRSHRCDE